MPSLALAALIVLFAAVSPVVAQPPRQPLEHGVSLALPDGWVRESARAGKNRRIHFACKTKICERTLETCTVVLLDEAVEGETDAARFVGLYASAWARYARLRAVLEATSRHAMLRSTLAVERIGARDWHVVETDARHNMKSGLFAETVIDGRYIGLICKTCETGEIRHRDAHAIMASLSRE